MGKDFRALSKAEVAELTEMREKRTGSKKHKSNKWEKKKEGVASLTPTVASLLTVVTELKDQVQVPEEVREQDEQMAPADNRTNRNLACQGSRS